MKNILSFNKNLLVVLFLSACGAKEGAETLEQVKAQDTAEPTEQVDGQTVSYSVSKKAELPECFAKIQSQLAYVRDAATFYSCEAEAWQKVEIQGKDGANGQDGKDGVDGVAGAAGQDGQDGDSPYQPTLVSSTGVTIGRIVTIDTATNRYWVIKDDGTRLEVSRDGTLLTSNYYYYSGANCTGTRRMVRVNGQWANTLVNEYEAKVYRQTGAYVNAFAYQSRATSTCTNTTGTVNRAFLVNEVSLQGYGTWGEVEISD